MLARAREQAIDTVRIDGLDTYLAEPVAAAALARRRRGGVGACAAIARGRRTPGPCAPRWRRCATVPTAPAISAGSASRTVVSAARTMWSPRAPRSAALADAIPGATLDDDPRCRALSALERPVEFAAILARMLPA